MATAALFERDPRRPAQPAADFFDQPVPQRPAGRRPGGVRPVADDRGPAGRPRSAGRRNGRRSARAGQLRRGAGVAAAVQAPRDAADRLRRHRAQSAGRHGRPADFVPGRRDRRSGARLRPAASATSSTASRCAPTASEAGSSCSALGKLGGVELNYSSDIDLIFLYEQDGQTDARRTVSNQEYFERLAKEVIRLLTETTELGSAYRVDLRLRPEGSRGPLCLSFDSTLSYYDVKGRTWERQAFVKARPIAGDLDLGSELLARLEPWIYRKLPQPRRHHRHQVAQATHRAARRTRRRRPAEREDRPRRHSRHRIRDPVPATAQRRRAAGSPHRQHARGDRPAGASRLPHARGADQARRQLQLAAQARASAADHVRFARRTCCPTTATSWPSWPCGWATPARGIARRCEAFKDDYAQRTRAEPRDARPSAARRVSRRRRGRAGSRPGERSRPAAGANSSRCSAAIRSTTCRPRTKT